MAPIIPSFDVHGGALPLQPKESIYDFLQGIEDVLKPQWKERGFLLLPKAVHDQLFMELTVELPSISLYVSLS